MAGVVAALWLAMHAGLLAGAKREQVIQLQAGWNAVHLEVIPDERRPSLLLEGTPVDVVARYYRRISSVEFIEDPADSPWNRESWGVWYAPGREDSFLSNLHAIDGNQCYLIHATSAFQWSLTGEVRHVRRSWRNESFNLVGFTVDPQAPPTFARLFEGAGGRIGGKIYRLQNDRWVKVLSPAATAVRPGEAFWTYCEGNTDFQGPLEVEIAATGALEFGTRSQRLPVKWKAAAGAGVQVSVSVVAAAGAGPALPLRRVVRDLSTLSDSYPLLAAGLSGEAPSGKMSLLVRREDQGDSSRSALLKFSDGAGSLIWVPATAGPLAE